MPEDREKAIQVDTKKEFAGRKEAFLRWQTQLEFEIHQYWKPHLGQSPIALAIFRDWNRYIFLKCGRKMGKTDLTIYCLYMFALLFPNSQVYYIAPTLKHGNELVWDNGRLPKFFLNPKRLPGESNGDFNRRRSLGRRLNDKYIKKSLNSESRVILNNGSFIKVEGAENYANADGLEPDFVAYDEFKSHDKRFHEAMEPNLRVKKAPLLIVGTPPEELDTYYDKIADMVQKLSYGAFYQRPSYLNPLLYPGGKNDPEFLEEWDKYIARGEEDVARRELLAETIVSGSKSIFPMLKLPEKNYDTGEFEGHSTHVRPHVELLSEVKHSPKNWEYVNIFDPGSTTCFGSLIGVMNKKDKRVFILDEIYERDQRKTTTGQIYPRAIEKRRNVQAYDDYWEVQYDHAAAWFYNEVVDQFDEAMTPCTKDMKDKENKLSLIKDMLLNRKLFISKRCLWLLWEMSHYRKDDKGKIPKENDHLIDCLRYFLNAVQYSVEDLHIPNIEDNRRGYTIEEDMRTRMPGEESSLLGMDTRALM